MNLKILAPIILVAGVVFLGGIFGAQNFLSYTSTNDKPQTASPAPSSIVVVSPLPSPKGENTDTNDQILKDITAGGISCDLEDNNGKVVRDTCRVDKVAGNFAKGTMPRAYWIATKTNNQWKVVVTGNGIPECNEIDKHSIPKEIYGNCIESSTELRY